MGGQESLSGQLSEALLLWVGLPFTVAFVNFLPPPAVRLLKVGRRDFLAWERRREGEGSNAEEFILKLLLTNWPLEDCLLKMLLVTFFTGKGGELIILFSQKVVVTLVDAESAGRAAGGGRIKEGEGVPRKS